MRELHGWNQRAAAKAAGHLESNLCHQHVQLASAAVPALPFILDAMKGAKGEVLDEILYVLRGFASGCAADTWVLGPPEYLPELFRLMETEREHFLALKCRTDGEIGEAAEAILNDLDIARSRIM